jgi:hypothetical protein
MNQRTDVILSPSLYHPEPFARRPERSEGYRPTQGELREGSFALRVNFAKDPRVADPSLRSG